MTSGAFTSTWKGKINELEETIKARQEELNFYKKEKQNWRGGGGGAAPFRRLFWRPAGGDVGGRAFSLTRLMTPERGRRMTTVMCWGLQFDCDKSMDYLIMPPLNLSTVSGTILQFENYFEEGKPVWGRDPGPGESWGDSRASITAYYGRSLRKVN